MRFWIAAISALLLSGCVQRRTAATPPTTQPPNPVQVATAGPGRYDKWFRDYTLLHFGNLVSPRWPKAVGMAESNLKYNAKSSVGALGLMQFMPATWTSVAPEPYKSLGAMDPESAIWVGCKYLRWNWERVPTETVDDRKAFTNAAYNSGLGWTLKARQKCRSNPPCDANLWTNNVELNLVTNPSAQEENRRYVARIRQFEQRLLLASEFL